MNEVNAKRTLDVFNRAVRLEIDKRYTEALAYYKEGIVLTTDILKVGVVELEESALKPLREKMDQYVKRVEILKEFISQQTKNENYHEGFLINNNETGYSYNTLFGRFLDYTVTFIIVEDPNIITFEQFQNLIRLCEVAVQKCPHLRHIIVVTTSDPKDRDQELWFTCLKFELIKSRVNLVYQLVNACEDKCISFNTGWHIRLSRGLDIHKPFLKKYGLGYSDFDLRPCYQTKVDIFFSKNIRHAQLSIRNDNLF